MTVDLAELFIAKSKERQLKIKPINDLIDDFNKLQNELSSIKQNFTQISQEKQDLENQVTQLKLTSKIISPELLEKHQKDEETIRQLQAELLEIHKNRGDTANQVISLTQKVKNLENTNADKSSQLDTQNETICKLNNENNNLKNNYELKKKAVLDLSDELQIQNQTIRRMEKDKTQLDVDYNQAIEQLMKYKNKESEKLDSENVQFKKYKKLEAENDRLTAIIKNCNCSKILFGFENIDLPMKNSSHSKPHSLENNSGMVGGPGQFFGNLVAGFGAGARDRGNMRNVSNESNPQPVRKITPDHLNPQMSNFSLNSGPAPIG